MPVPTVTFPSGTTVEVDPDIVQQWRDEVASGDTTRSLADWYAREIARYLDADEVVDGYGEYGDITNDQVLTVKEWPEWDAIKDEIDTVAFGLVRPLLEQMFS